MKTNDYMAVRRLQQKIPLPIPEVAALLSQHGSPGAACAAYRARQIDLICQTAHCSPAQAAYRYGQHQGNIERAISAICETPVYLGEDVIDGEKWGYIITPLNRNYKQVGRYAFIQHRNFEWLKPALEQHLHQINPTSSNYFTVGQGRKTAVKIRALAQNQTEKAA
ncbi:MAG: hypothetical protein Q3966_05820, partial [Neisseria sp.]|nr:hypothetical protein [Neisseria sp.]